MPHLVLDDAHAQARIEAAATRHSAWDLSAGNCERLSLVPRIRRGSGETYLIEIDQTDYTGLWTPTRWCTFSDVSGQDARELLALFGFQGIYGWMLLAEAQRR